MVIGGLHESEFEWARLKLGPAKSADIDGEIQPFRVEPSGFWDVLVQLQYPPKRRRCHFSVFAAGDLERESAESRTRLLINHLRPKAQGPSLYRELCAAFQYICQNDLFSLNCYEQFLKVCIWDLHKANNFFYSVPLAKNLLLPI